MPKARTKIALRTVIAVWDFARYGTLRVLGLRAFWNFAPSGTSRILELCALLPLEYRGITNPHLGRHDLEASGIRRVRTGNGMLAELAKQASQQRVRSRHVPIRQSLE